MHVLGYQIKNLLIKSHLKISEFTVGDTHTEEEEWNAIAESCWSHTMIVITHIGLYTTRLTICFILYSPQLAGSEPVITEEGAGIRSEPHVESCPSVVCTGLEHTI